MRLVMRWRRFAVNRVVVALRGACPVTSVMAPRMRGPIRLIFRGALRATLFVDQRLPVGDGNLIVIGMNFAEGEKAVAVAAVIDKSGLQRRLDARHLRQIDVAS